MSKLLENIPKDWEFSTLGALNSRKAPTINPKDFADETFEYYSIPDYQRDQRPSLTQGGAIESSKLHLKPKTVLFGKLNPRVEKVWRVTESTEFRQIGSTEWIAILPNERVDADFLYFLEWSDHVMPIAKTLVSGSTPSRQRVDPTSFYRLRVPLPPLPEQKKIAHILSTVQRAIEAQERIIQTTTELKKALMHKLFTEGLRNEPQKQTEIGPVPESWEVVALSDVCRFQSGGTPSKKNPEFWMGTIPWVSPKDMKRPRLADVEDHISQEALESGSKLAPAGSVFVVVRGMILAKTVPVALAEVPMAINQDMKAIVPGSKLRSDFLLYALEALRENLFKKVGRSGHGTCTLMGHEVAAFKISLPDLAEQEEIASAIQNLERKKELHDEKRKQLQDIFRTLLHELMTAKTRVHKVAIT